jgi:hypothetical protein
MDLDLGDRTEGDDANKLSSLACIETDHREGFLFEATGFATSRSPDHGRVRRRDDPMAKFKRGKVLKDILKFARGPKSPSLRDGQTESVKFFRWSGSKSSATRVRIDKFVYDLVASAGDGRDRGAVPVDCDGARRLHVRSLVACSGHACDLHDPDTLPESPDDPFFVR